MTKDDRLIPGPDNRNRERRVGSSLIRWVAFVLIAAVLVLAFSDLFFAAWDRIRHEPIEVSWHLLAALGFFTLAVIVSGYLWAIVLKTLGVEALSAKDASRAHVVSWLLKYIPGQIGSFAYKLYWGHQRGFRSRVISVSFVYENIFLQLASLAPGILILLIYFGREAADFQHVAIGSLVVAILLAVIFSAEAGARRILPLLPESGQRGISDISFLTPQANLRLTTLYLIPRLLNGVGFILVVANLADVNPADWLLLGGAYAIAGAVGILAVFVPSGLGVREAVLAILIAPVVGAEIAILAALLARIVSLSADVLLLVIATMTGLVTIKAKQ